MKKIVMILGAQGSGISMVAQMCQCMGGYFGEREELVVTADNLNGYFENRKIARINEDILHFSGQEWYGLVKHELDYNHQQLIKMLKELKANIQILLEKSDTVVIKDSRVSVLLSVWGRILEELGVDVSYIWILRNPLEATEILRKRKGYSKRHGMLLWTYYNLSILQFLKEKQYLLINYRDIAENFEVLVELGQLFDRNLDNDLERELKHIIKQEYCYSCYSNQSLRKNQNELALDFYSYLISENEEELKKSDWEKRYESELPNMENRYVDYNALEDIKCLEKKEIVIYGAGNCGKQAAKMLQELGLKYDFCDRDINKQGNKFMEGKVFSIMEIEERKNLCIIIAIEREDLKKEIEQTLLCIKGANFLSFFALKKAWRYSRKDDTTFETKAGAFSLYYYRLLMRTDHIKKACEYPVLVYQNGKVGSMTVSNSLWAVGVENAHIHGFFFKDDIIGELVLGNEYKNFINRCNILSGELSEYSEYVKEKIKGKKIISMVREPIAVDLSTVFQWTNAGSTDRYFVQNLRQGESFVNSVSKLMVRIQGRLFRWFDEELKELTDIDVFSYPFDREKGYSIISKNDVEILLIKAEKLSQMTEVIRNFIGNHQVELVNHNLGKNKEYAHIYEEVKKKLEIPKEYMDYYYKNNSYMDHFYTEKEKEVFMKKWMRCIKEPV